MPKVLVSTLPELVDFSDTEKVAKFLAFKNSLSKSDLDKEQAEKVVIDGIKAYFEENSHEDVFVLFNQDVYVNMPTSGKRSRFERDGLIINLTKGYILNIEAKSYLSNCRKGAKQLSKTLDILKNCPFYECIEQNWLLIRILYGSKINDTYESCGKCTPFIITRRYNFIQKLSNILNPLNRAFV